jgi:glutaredoxin
MLLKKHIKKCVRIVVQLFGDNMFEIYGQEGCFSCILAKSILDSRNLKYKEYIVGKDISQEEFLEKFPQRYILPVILRDGLRMTGLAELEQYVNENNIRINSEL